MADGQEDLLEEDKWEKYGIKPLNELILKRSETSTKLDFTPEERACYIETSVFNIHNTHTVYPCLDCVEQKSLFQSSPNRVFECMYDFLKDNEDKKTTITAFITQIQHALQAQPTALEHLPSALFLFFALNRH